MTFAAKFVLSILVKRLRRVSGFAAVGDVALALGEKMKGEPV
jgi:hypothetical protein